MCTINTETILSWKYAKEHLQLCIAPAGTNDEFVVIPYLDLELYFRVRVSEESSYKVKRQILDVWDVTKEELLTIALNTNINKYSATSMNDIMLELLMDSDATDDEIADLIAGTTPNQTVITNKERLFGAAALYKKEIFKEIADEYRSDLFIIPSSIHELIVFPKDYCFTKKHLDEMIRDVNRNEIHPEERLSDHAYIFRRNTMEIEW